MSALFLSHEVLLLSFSVVSLLVECFAPSDDIILVAGTNSRRGHALLSDLLPCHCLRGHSGCTYSEHSVQQTTVFSIATAVVVAPIWQHASRRPAVATASGLSAVSSATRQRSWWKEWPLPHRYVRCHGAVSRNDGEVERRSS